MAEYYTYKTQVPLKSGEKLGFTPGRGYYAIAAATPAKTSAPAKSVSTEELGGLSATQAERVAGSYGLTTTTTGEEGSGTSSSSSTTSTSPPTKHATQPSKAPTAAAKTPMAAEAAAKSMITDAYRPVVFKIATKAKPNAALIEAAHRQGGIVAHPVTVAKTTKPDTANAKKNETKSVKAASTTTSKKTAVKSTAPAAKHPPVPAATTFHTYKKDVHLKPGQTLAYTAGKGYYAMAARAAGDTSEDRFAQPTKAHSGVTLLDRSRTKTRTLASSSSSRPITRETRGRNGRPPSFLGKLLAAVSSAAAHGIAVHPLVDAHAKHPPKQWQSSGGREQYAHRYFATSLGLSSFQAAAIVGNFAVESYAFQRPGKPHLVANLGQYGGGGGYGIAQWALPQRKEALQDFAKKQGLSHANFGLQLAYAAHELTTDGESKYGRLIAKGTIEALRDAKSPAEAVAIVMVGYERPGGQDGQQWRHVPPFPSVVKLAKQYPPPNTLLPVPSIANDASGYRARLSAATRIAHDKGV